MNTKKILSLLLAALLTASMVACGESEPVGETGSGETTPAGETAAAETEITRENIPDNLPDKKFDGRNFHLLSRQDFDVKFIPEDLNGEAVNDALYNRNTEIMERFDITMTMDTPVCTWGDTSKQWNNNLQNSVMAGDGAYDLVAGYAATVPEVVTKNILLNWHDVPFIDMSQPWWSDRVSEALTVNGKLFLLTGDYSLSLWDNMFGFLFNKQVALDHDIEDLYDLVRTGKWTMDKMTELASKVAYDSDGNGSYDANDTYGLLTNWSTSIDTFQIACEMDIISHTDDGGLEITMMSEKAVDIVNRVVSLFHDAHVMYSFSGDNDFSVYNNMFSNGQALFYANIFENINKLRDMDTDFGILPYPKLNEAQADYASTSRDNFDLFVLPIDVKDQEFSGIVTEALCAESYRSVIPAYYDVVLKSKSARDEESAEMIDLIRDTLTFDMGYLFSSSLGGLGHIFVGMVRDGNTDLASKFAAVEKAAQTNLDAILESYGYTK